MAGIVQVIDGVIDLIRKNIIAKTNVTADVITGDTIVYVENSFQFNNNEEVVLIDYGYNDENSSHYHIYEYAKIKEVNNTRAITLMTPSLSDWTLANSAFVQKTIGHSPLYEDQVLYGDREVIPTDLMAVTIEPVSKSNEWIYLQGGLSEEFVLEITVYGKDIKMEEGRRILDEYSDSIYKLLNDNLHIDVTDYSTPLLSNAVVGGTEIIIADTATNREKFVVSTTSTFDYQLQDNTGVSCWFQISSVATGGGIMRVFATQTIPDTFYVSEYGVLTRLGRYFYDSRVDNITYGQISKGSAILRASKLHWFGKEVNELTFPQPSKGVDYFPLEIEDATSSTSSESS